MGWLFRNSCSDTAENSIGSADVEPALTTRLTLRHTPAATITVQSILHAAVIPITIVISKPNDAAKQSKPDGLVVPGADAVDAAIDAVDVNVATEPPNAELDPVAANANVADAADDPNDATVSSPACAHPLAVADGARAGEAGQISWYL